MKGEDRDDPAPVASFSAPDLLEEAPPEFRRFVVLHDTEALVLAVLSLIAAGVLWMLVYGAVYAFVLISATIDQSWKHPDSLSELGDARQLVGRHFSLVFVLIAAGFVALVRFLRTKRAESGIMSDRNILLQAFIDLLLLLPNLTLAVGGNLRAILWLDRNEMARAWRVFRRVGDLDGEGLPLTSLGLEIGGDEDSHRRTVFALQIAGLVLTRHGDSDWLLVLADEKARDLYRRITQAKDEAPMEETAAPVEENAGEESDDRRD